MKEVTFSKFTCIRCKLPPWIREKMFLLSMESSKLVMHMCEVLSGLVGWAPPFYMGFLAHKPLIDLLKDKKFIDKCTRTSISSMMVFHLNSVVFYYKTTRWSCLSEIACSRVCSRTISCFGACYRSSFPENLATSSRRIVLQTFIFLSRLDESGIS